MANIQIQKVTRRQMLKAFAGAGAAVTAAPMINLGRFRLFANSPIEYSARAAAVVTRSLVVDMLSPLTLNFPKQAKWFSNPDSFTAADLQPFKESDINVFHIAVGMGGRTPISRR